MVTGHSVLGFLTLLGTVPCLTSADVKFVEPEAGSQFDSGTVLAVSWVDSGRPPPLADLTNYVLNLCAGGNIKGSFMCPLAVLKTSGTFSGSDTAAGVLPIPPEVGSDSENGYFLQMVSTTLNGGIVYNYSSRFGIMGMKGEFTLQVDAGIRAVGSSLDGPQASEGATGSTGSSSIIAPVGSFAIPYNKQQGPVRYAPMQPRPPTKISVQTAKPLWPTSQVQTARSVYGAPAVSTTITQPRTYSVHSMENTAAPAPHPKDDMARWLERWKD